MVPFFKGKIKAVSSTFFHLWLGSWCSVSLAKWLSSPSKKGCPTSTDTLLNSQVLHIYNFTNTSVLCTEPLMLISRSSFHWFPSLVGRAGFMAWDSHTGTCPQKGIRAGFNALLPPLTFLIVFSLNLSHIYILHWALLSSQPCLWPLLFKLSH